MASGLDPVPLALTRQKTDPAWKHCQMYKSGDKVQLKCLYCSKLFKGGGIHRIKEHLAGHKGNASTCLRTPPDVRQQMQQSLDGVVAKRRRKQKIDEVISTINPQTSNEEIDAFAIQSDANGKALSPTPAAELDFVESHNESADLNLTSYINQEGGVNKSGVRRKRAKGKSVPATHEGVNLSAMVLSTKRVNSQIHAAIGRFLYDIGASSDAVNSVYFQPMFDEIASGGPDVLPPTYNDLRGPVLKSVLDEVKNDTAKHTAAWGKTGCSLMVEQSNTEMGRTFLKFFVYAPEGTVFLKSVDATDFVHSSDILVEVLKQVVEEVGVKNVLQVITKGEEQYVVAGKKLMDIFPTLYWSPCAAECIDLILKDFENLEWISGVIEQARSITRFIYNHAVVLNLLRRYTFGYDIIEIAGSRSATNFATLKRMVDLKSNLLAMVTSQEWVDCPYAKKQEGLELLDYANNESFWSSCILITRLTSSLMRLFKIVSSGKRPAMGYVYAGMYKAKEAIKKELLKREDYVAYWDIIDHRWERHWSLPLHAAGFYLNPKFFYSIEGDIPSEIISGMFDCIERLVTDTKVQDKIIKEINSYKSAAGDLGRKVAIRARESILPAEWWLTYGGGCPNLMRLAIRILSQTCRAIGSQRNLFSLDQIHESRNCLEHQRLSDLLYVHYNLQLRKAGNVGGGLRDPLFFESQNLVEDWIVGKDSSLEEYSSSDWMALDPPSASSLLLGAATGETEDLDTGFNDYEILNRLKDGEDDNAEDNAAN